MKRARLFGLAFACAIIAAAVAASAAEPGAKDESRVSLTWEQFKAVTGWDGVVTPGEILIPWAEAQKLLGVEIKDMDTAKVKLTWTQFRTLVEASLTRDTEDKVPPPAPYVITKAVYVGTLSKDLAKFEMTMDVDILKTKGWKRIPLLPATVGVDDAALPKDAFLNVQGNVYEMLTQAATGKVQVKLKFAVAVSEDGGMNSVSFERVQSGTCLLDLRVDSKDMKVTVAGAQDISPKGSENRLFALPAGNRVAITWDRELKEVAKAEPKRYAQTQTLVAVGDGLVTCRQRIAYSIVHAGVRELTLTVPDGVNVLDVQCSYLHDWRVEARTLKLQLEREVKGLHTVNISFEKALKEGGDTLDTPVIVTADTERERGSIAVVALANVEISSEKQEGASSIDATALPPELVALTAQPVLLAYRYVDKKFSVPLKIKKHEDVKVLVTVVEAATVTMTQTIDGPRVVRVVYDVRNNRNQFLRVKMPAKSEIWTVSVSGKAARPALDEQGMHLIPLERSSGQNLAAFPVEIYYIDKSFVPDKTKGEGAMKVELPRCSEPVMNLMCELYLPKEGKYTDFAGPLATVKDFREVRAQVTDASGNVTEVQPQQAQQRLQEVVDDQLRRSAAPGTTPIKVSLPTDGKVVRLQKILVLGLDEALTVEFNYSRWPGYSSGFLGLF